MIHDVQGSTLPGIHTTLCQAACLYYWPHMRKDVINWAKACQRCQVSKVTKHNTTAPVPLPPSCGKFHDIHLDVVGPLSELKGMHYILTAVDSFSH